MKRRISSRILLLGILAGLLLSLGMSRPGVALAHAYMTRAIPPPSSVLPRSPTQAILTFSEDLNGAASRIVVWDRYRHVENVGSAQLVSGQSRELQVPLKTLAAGSYLVLWTSVSAEDGHILHGSYVFSVVRRGPLPSLVGISTGTAQTFPDGEGLVNILAHWIELTSAITWVGSIVFATFIFGVFTRDVEPDIREAELRRRRLTLRILLLLLLLASTVLVALQAHDIGGSWADAFTTGTLSSIFTAQFGRLWIARQVLVLIALALIAIPVSRARLDSGADSSLPVEEMSKATIEGIEPPGGMPKGRPPSSPYATQVVLPIVMTVISLVYLYLFAASGHAASSNIGSVAGSRLFSGSVLVDWLHFLATALWLGGQIYIVAVLAPTLLSRRDLGPHAGVFLRALNRFSPVAYASIATFTLSGAFNGKIHIDSWYAFFHSVYGWALIVKILLIGLMMLVSVVTVYGLRPRIKRAMAAAHRDIRQGSVILMDSLVQWLRAGPVFGLGVLLATSVMFYYPVPLGLAPPGPSTLTARGNGLIATVTLKPNRAGPNAIRVRLTDTAGKPLGGARIVILDTMLDMIMGTGLINLSATPTPGIYAGDADLGMGGHWRLQLLIYNQAGQLTRLSVEVTVGL